METPVGTDSACWLAIDQMSANFMPQAVMQVASWQGLASSCNPNCSFANCDLFHRHLALL
ncbi:MAG: hypothetical protein EBT08_22065 [Betaproteobacteria bacterium]|nr:hypothetical protein [Betaproteobacteria bacterium]